MTGTDLRRHRLKHNEVKPYPCHLCEKQFTRSHDLKVNLLLCSWHFSSNLKVVDARIKSEICLNSVFYTIFLYFMHFLGY